KETIINYLLSVKEEKGAGYIVLIDPDKNSEKMLEEKISKINSSGVDAIFVGGSLILDNNCERRVAKIKSLSELPVIFFPGGISQLNKHYDAMLFMSILSGRNPHYLIGEQVIAAPIVKDLGIEAIPTGYLIVDGGNNSSVQFMSGSSPIPIDKPDILVAHALAAQYLGKKLVYLESGSGAKNPIPNQLVEAVNNYIDIPIIVGGGIRTPESAYEKVQAGASFIVTGTVIEDANINIIKEFADAIHKS
ncbi:MAG: geranylgeranylglyceryl/heptaprenylglyceryl phosphate synthase, partial [Candidatus Neomarinimicrobiota bacterium]|nr:geranylgeranylglyceryl/heptaprenylglyceryl phosphate synthase [Candidatus Neomarinimicrobiota bacterium]